MSENPYSPPSASLDQPIEATATPAAKKLPFLLLLRLALVLWALGTGVNETTHYISNWNMLSQKAIIDGTYHPLPPLALGLLHIAAGIALLLRHRLAILFFGLHFVGYLIYLFLPYGFMHIPLFLVGYLGAEAISLWLCLNLWAHKQLH